ncbi:MAG: hypothetical protein ACOCSE_02020 [Chitinivibrionales bacterium]
MYHPKVNCYECPHRFTCSTQTKLYINYCGSGTPESDEKIEIATEICKRKFGKIFQRSRVHGITDI